MWFGGDLAVLGEWRVSVSASQNDSVILYPIDNSGRPWSWYLWIAKIAKVRCREGAHPGMSRRVQDPSQRPFQPCSPSPSLYS